MYVFFTFVCMLWSSLYYDEDGDLAHEFYEETVVTKNGRKKAKLKRIHKNLIPQVSQHRNVLLTFSTFTLDWIIISLWIFMITRMFLLYNIFRRESSSWITLVSTSIFRSSSVKLDAVVDLLWRFRPPSFSSRPLDPGHACCVAPPWVWEGSTRVCWIPANGPRDALGRLPEKRLRPDNDVLTFFVFL